MKVKTFKGNSVSHGMGKKYIYAFRADKESQKHNCTTDKSWMVRIAEPTEVSSWVAITMVIPHKWITFRCILVG